MLNSLVTPLIRRVSLLRRWLLIPTTVIFIVAATCSLTLFFTITAHAQPNPPVWPTLHLELVEDGFNLPLEVVSANDGTGRLFVLERGGRIEIIQNGVRLDQAFLNISDRVATCGECGLLGVAFPADFKEKGYFFVNYISKVDLAAPDTGDPNSINDTVIARFHVSDDDPNRADDEEEQILTINQPWSNHNGGHILFGPDGYLYIGMGDGGGLYNLYQNGQDPASLHSKILRIGVSETATYTIPADNPFVNTAGYRPEIWATGLRNPWRFNFDRVTGDLYIADVGEGTIEEINYITASVIGRGGMNFGWSITEGNACFPPGGAQNCDRFGLTSPVMTYTHELGDCSVIGGYVYRSPRPEQAPVYLYGDFCTGRIWGMQQEGAQWVKQELLDTDFMISSFGEDEAGNLYGLDYGGAIYRILDYSYANYAPSIFGTKIITEIITPPITETITVTITVTITSDTR